MSKLLDNLRRLFQRQPDPIGPNLQPGSRSAALVDDDSIAALMRLIEQTNEGEYSCAETFDLLDEYVEMVLAEEDVEALMPLVKKHLDHCPDCGPRYEILLDILQNT